jgi:thiol-disulfide isomerase/thioredoxin
MKISNIQSCLLAASIVILFAHCTHGPDITAFNLDGKSALILLNDTDDSININYENWSIIPAKMHPVDTFVLQQKVIKFNFIIQGLDYQTISIDGVKHLLFMQPSSRDSIVIQKGTDGKELAFFGDSKAINEFVDSKGKYFNSVDADWIVRAEATQRAEDLNQIVTINDSINQLHRNYLHKNSRALPDWFVEFEDARLNYLSAGFKMSSLFYRKRFLDKDDEFEKDFYYNPKETIDANFPLLAGNVRYITFLNNYLELLADSSLQEPKPTSNQEWRDYYKHRFDLINDELTGSVKDVYLSFVLSNIIESRRHVLDTSWVSKVNDEKMSDFLRKQLNSIEVLPGGAQAPYFYLTDSNGTAYTPEHFIGKVVLINFWSTMCKPCIEEFPYENSLVEKFKDEPVQIISICMESKPDQWLMLIKKHKLKTLNLLSEGNWDLNLSKKYDINGWPHSVLINSDGKIIKNKCRRASDGVDYLIDEILARGK